MFSTLLFHTPHSLIHSLTQAAARSPTDRCNPSKREGEGKIHSRVPSTWNTNCRKPSKLCFGEGKKEKTGCWAEPNQSMCTGRQIGIHHHQPTMTGLQGTNYSFKQKENKIQKTITTITTREGGGKKWKQDAHGVKVDIQ